MFDVLRLYLWGDGPLDGVVLAPWLTYLILGGALFSFARLPYDLLMFILTIVRPRRPRAMRPPPKVVPRRPGP